MSEDWKLTGEFFECCNCDVVCPCIFLKPPSNGTCKGYLAWHITDGTMGRVNLSHLNVAIWLDAPGLLVDGNIKMSYYIDESASSEQHDALAKIFTGQAGGHPAVLAGLVGENVGVHTAKIRFLSDGKRRELDVEGVGTVRMNAVEGADGGTVTLLNHPLAVAPGSATTAYESEHLDYSCAGTTGEHSGTSGLGAHFQYSSD